MSERTLEDAERDYDRALEDGALAVSIMQEKLDKLGRDAQIMLAAVVLAAGGKVDVHKLDTINAYGAVVTIDDNPVTGGITITSKRK